jgi:hypothetical protein
MRVRRDGVNPLNRTLRRPHVSSRLGFSGLPNLATDVESRFESRKLSIVSEPLPQRSVLAFQSVVAIAWTLVKTTQ